MGLEDAFQTWNANSKKINHQATKIVASANKGNELIFLVQFGVLCVLAVRLLSLFSWLAN